MGYVDRNIRILSKLLKPLPREQNADAAVALLLKPVGRTFKALFVKRIVSPSDPWSGQMALPGGKRDEKDQNLRQTVSRETLEEVNIDLLNYCRLLGVMETLKSIKRPDLKVLPFVFLLKHEPRIKLNKELEEFAWISLEELAQQRGTVEFSFGEVPAYIVGKRVIWGLTYRILEKLFGILKSSR